MLHKIIHVKNNYRLRRLNIVTIFHTYVKVDLILRKHCNSELRLKVYNSMIIHEPRHEKTCLLGFRLGPTQIKL